MSAPTMGTKSSLEWGAQARTGGGVALGGSLVFLAGFPQGWPWLQLFAFVPFLAAVLGSRSWRAASGMGVAWGLARVLPLGAMVRALELPPIAAAVVLLYLLMLDAVFAVVVYWARNLRTLLLAPTIAGAFATIEWLDALLPMWGTARSLAASWSSWPEACGMIRVLGAPSIAFVVVLLQALGVVAVRRREPRSAMLAVALGVAGLALSIVERPTEQRTLRVAAVGWGTQSRAEHAEEDVVSATAEGARLVVFPEAEFKLDRGTRPAFEAHWSDTARERHVWLVLPFVAYDTNENSLLVLDAEGRIRGTYTKRHLVPRAETWEPGSGRLLVLDVDGVRVGFAICQDDNFPDVARAYAQAGAQLLVVPTFEGPASVAPYHFANSRLRSIENDLALVRAVAQGTSALLAPGGFLVAARTWAGSEGGVLAGDVPVRIQKRGSVPSR